MVRLLSVKFKLLLVLLFSGTALYVTSIHLFSTSLFLDDSDETQIEVVQKTRQMRKNSETYRDDRKTETNNYHDNNYTEREQIIRKTIQPKRRNITSLEELREEVKRSNEEQTIHNEDLHGKVEENDIVILVQVHNRLLYLKELITSLSKSDDINSTLIIFSHNIYDAKINDAIFGIKFAKTMQIFFPYSLQLYPDTFPGYDIQSCLKDKPKNKCTTQELGKKRNATTNQMKHHWWWKGNQVFRHVRALRNHTGLVVMLEEDHIVARDFLLALKIMEKTAAGSYPEVKMFALGNHESRNTTPFNLVNVGKRMDNFGLSLTKKTWLEIFNHAETFCKFNDYNWDWTLQFILQRRIKPVPLSMKMALSRVQHIGLCGFHHNNNNCDPKKLIEDFEKLMIHRTFSDNPKQEVIVQKEKTIVYTAENGGWEDPRDHDLCLSM